MKRLTVNDDKCTFSRDGKPFFWLADTLWSAFTNMNAEDLDTYLTVRKQQGFNVLQINILPQWDRCYVNAPYMPFGFKENGGYDYEKGMNDDYFEHAKHVLDKIVSYDFTPALVVLWLNHVPGTWGSALSNNINVMPKEFIKPYCQKVAETFDSYNPVYVISGDTDLDTDSAKEYYRIALDTMCELSPDTLKTLHIKGRYTYLPEEYLDKMDFYMFQSGHNALNLDKCYTMPVEMLEKYPAKPILNAEPCYEQMGFSGYKYGRFNTKDVRRAAWMSVLSGACAGVTYGAHGIWNFQKLYSPVNPNTGEGFDAPKPWTEALYFKGAWDYGYIKNTVSALGELHPDNRIGNTISGLKTEVLEDGTKKMTRVISVNPEIKMATTKDGKTSLIYAPFNTKIVVNEDLSDCKVTVVDMNTKNTAHPFVEGKDGKSYILMTPFDEDVLVVIERR